MAQTHWNTQEMVNRLAPLGASMLVEKGDGTTSDLIILTAKDALIDQERTGKPYNILVRGFDADPDQDGPIDSQDCQISMVELNDGREQGNPITAKCKATRDLYFATLDLLFNSGFEMVMFMKAYF